MSNKLLLIILWISLAGIILGMMLKAIAFHTYASLSNFFSGVFLLTGIYLLLKNGTFIKSKEFKVMLFAGPILLIGIMFKIMHWKYSGELLLTAFSSIFLIYTFHFVKKSSKGLTDWGKLLFVFLFLFGRAFKIFHWPYGDELFLASFVVLTVLLFNFINKTVLTQSRT